MANKELGNMALCIEDDAWKGLDKSIMATSRCCSCRASCAHSFLHTSSELPWFGPISLQRQPLSTHVTHELPALFGLLSPLFPLSGHSPINLPDLLHQAGCFFHKSRELESSVTLCRIMMWCSLIYCTRLQKLPLCSDQCEPSEYCCTS